MNAILALLIVTAHADSTVKPGEAIRIEGKVVDAKGNPAADGEIIVSSYSVFEHNDVLLNKVILNSNGSFALDLVVPRNAIDFNQSATVWALRDDASIAGFAFHWKEPPEKPITIKLGLKNLDRIIVHDFFGKPVAGARVAPIRLRVDGLTSWNSGLPDELAERLGATTDAAGEALIERAAPNSIASLRVKSERFGSQFGDVPAKGEAFRLAQVGRVRGRLKADNPQAVQGRLVCVEHLGSTNRNDVSKSGIALIRTDHEGQFEIPAFIAGKVFVQIVNQTADEDYRELRTNNGGMLIPGDLLDLTIPLVGRPKSRPEALAGRVLDSKGDPVPGATVFSRGDTFITLSDITDRDGAYRLEGVPRGRAFIFVRKPGYRFAGAVVPEDKSVLDLMIRRDDEKIDRPLKSLPTPLDAKERNALAREALEPYLEQLIKGVIRPELNKSLSIAALYDPERVLDLAEKNVFKDEIYDEFLRGLAACGYVNENVDEALAVVESIRNTSTKLRFYLDVFDRFPPSDRAKKLEILARARLHADNQKDPMRRTVAIARIADRLFDLGEDAQATNLLRDSLADARKSPIDADGGETIAEFAKSFAIVDPAAALNLIKDIKDNRLSDHFHGELAHEIAARFPAEAERVLSDIGDNNWREHYSMRVAYRMAPRDFDRARRISSLIGTPTLRAYTLGVMAENLARSNHDLAVSLIHEAFDTLERRLDHGPQHTIFPHEPDEVAAALLSSVEKIDPMLVDEFFWRAISFRTLGERIFERDRRYQSDAFLAAILARFNPAIARLFIEPIDVSTIDLSAYKSRNPLIASAAIDPRRAIDLLDQIPEPDRIDSSRFKDNARMEIALMLTHRDDEFWKYVISHIANLWIPDVENGGAFP
jgi:hypothetical protein